MRNTTTDDSGCWVWTGCRDKDGYGKAKAGGKMTMAHRWSYRTLVGPIPVGKYLDHLCKNRACVNPAHLEPVTPRENVLRSDGLPAINLRKTHCPAGHAYDQPNTYIGTGGRRVCRACKTTSGRAAYLARQANMP